MQPSTLPYTLVFLLVTSFVVTCTRADDAPGDDQVPVTESSGNTEVPLPLDKLVDPFDYSIWLPEQNDEKEYPHLGKVKNIGTLLSSPHFFPVKFSVTTRYGTTSGIKLEPQRYCLTINGSEAVQCREYEFDLTQLAPDSNSFNPERRTIILIPGFKSTEDVPWIDDARDKWLELEDVNVVSVYWPEGNNGLYDTAVANARIAARQITMLLYYLTQLHQVDFGSLEFRHNIHIVGHSLGAHLAGAVGQELRGQAGRITGLDPAGPIFDSLKEDERLDPSDAVLVDVIHTNAGEMSRVRTAYAFLKKTATEFIFGSSSPGLPLAREDSWWGINLNCGHLDYYANGGSEQPGCWDDSHNCDHMRAPDLYIKAIEFEIHSRRAHGPESSIILQGQHRLRAFPASSYEQFKSGEALMRNCPSLVVPKGTSQSGNDDLQALYQQCSVPIDFVSPAEKYRGELIRLYGMHVVDELGGPLNGRKLYFDTLATEPFVSDHQLLKAHLHRSAEVGAEGCKVSLIAHSHSKPAALYSVVVRDSGMKSVQSDDFYGLVIPFANPIDWRLTFPTPERYDEHLSQMRDLFHQELSTRSLVAGSVYIRLVSTPTRGLIPFFSKTEESCSLNVRALEMRPLVAVIHSVSSWYFGESENARLTIRQNNEPLEEDKNVLNLSCPDKPEATLYLGSIGVDQEVTTQTDR